MSKNVILLNRALFPLLALSLLIFPGPAPGEDTVPGEDPVTPQAGSGWLLPRGDAESTGRTVGRVQLVNTNLCAVCIARQINQQIAEQILAVP